LRKANAAGVQRFAGRLEAAGEGGAWVILKMPFVVREVFGTNGTVRVKGTLNGVDFKTSLFPTGDGSHHMMVNKGLQAQAGVGAGSRVKVTLQQNREPTKAIEKSKPKSSRNTRASSGLPC
jgi:Domain of unknown function (DUF1905)